MNQNLCRMSVTRDRTQPGPPGPPGQRSLPVASGPRAAQPRHVSKSSPLTRSAPATSSRFKLPPGGLGRPGRATRMAEPVTHLAGPADDPEPKAPRRNLAPFSSSPMATRRRTRRRASDLHHDKDDFHFYIDSLPSALKCFPARKKCVSEYCIVDPWLPHRVNATSSCPHVLKGNSMGTSLLL